MNPLRDQPTTTGDDPRLFRAVQEYLEELEAGRSPDREALAARYPDLIATMVPYLDALDAVHGATPLLPAAPDSRLLEEDFPAEPLGDFRIVREVGRGGMGIVYEAVQLSLGRRVALKVLPFAAALNARQLQRFKNEAHAAAQLHHTNIVPVYAVGQERGVHFYAMQLIEGQNLATIIEGLRQRTADEEPADGRARPGPDRTEPYVSAPAPAAAPGADTQPEMAAQFSTQRSARGGGFFRTAAKLAAQAAEGLDYAHGLGIVHRDIKPANLLVDGRANVWITDFGLAQFQTQAGLTQTGDLVGTLRYMSPEQAGGQHVLVDHRTDIYALGATLYELLTLRPIFDGQDQRTLLQQILNDEPKPPRTLTPSLPPELETIVLKAVAKVPSERYATARDFADDLNRYLRDEPIRARRPTLVQRGRKWLRRHPSVPVAAALLLLLLTAGSLAAAWLVRVEQAKTRQAFVEERQRAEEAEELLRLARRAADEMIEIAQEELADKPQMAGLRKRMLTAALAYYEKFIELRRDNSDAQTDLAATQGRVKKILADLAVLQGAGQFVLLTDRAVLDDLRLSDEQHEQIRTLTERMEEQRKKKFKAFYKMSAAERQRRFVELARGNEAAVAAILKPEKLHRLEQIALQNRGPSAFREADVAAALKLTAEQKQRIRAIEAETFFGPPPESLRRGGPGRGDPRQEHDKKMKEARDRIQALLTPAQAKQWREMTGAPFEGSTSCILPPSVFPYGGPLGHGPFGHGPRKGPGHRKDPGPVGPR